MGLANRLRSFAAAAAGTTAIEYALIAVLICGVAVPGYRMIVPALARMTGLQDLKALFATEEPKSVLTVRHHTVPLPSGDGSFRDRRRLRHHEVRIPDAEPDQPRRPGAGAWTIGRP